MRCPICREGTLSAQLVKNYHYRESGLENVYLAGIPVRTCGGCGERLVSIPNIEGLHRAIALALIRKEERLTPMEVRFLRKSLGWSGADFARKFHTSPQQVSRWESVKAPGAMSKANELLLRSLVAAGEKIEDDQEWMEKAASKASSSRKIRLLNQEGRWLKAA